MPQNIEDQIKAYLLEKLEKIKTVVPGHVSVTVRADRYSSGTEGVSYTAYSGHFNASINADTLDEAMAEIVAKTGGKSEAELLREQAARLLADAERLEAKIQKPNPGSKAALEDHNTFTQEAA